MSETSRTNGTDESKSRPMRINSFTKAKRLTDNAYQFFTTADLGMVDPMMRDGYTLDERGMPKSSPVIGPDNMQLNQYLREHELFGRQHIARNIILQILFHIYAKNNMLRANAAENRGKPYMQWNHKYYGATPELIDAFSAAFEKVQSRAGEPKTDSDGNPQLDMDGNVKTYPNLDENSFDLTFFSIAGNDNLINDASIPQPNKDNLKRYYELVQAEENKRKQQLSESKRVTGDELSGYYLIQFVNIAEQVAPNDEGLLIYAKLDKLQDLLSYINKLHAKNYEQIDKQRDEYRREQITNERLARLEQRRQERFGNN